MTSRGQLVIMSAFKTKSGVKRPSSQERTVSPPPLKRRVQSTTTQGAVTAFFTPASKKEPPKITWRTENDSLLIAQNALLPKRSAGGHVVKKHRIAAFDLDSTLIRTASGNQHPKDENDWRWWDPAVPGTLRSLHQDGYRIAVLSNQAGISLKKDQKSLKGDLRRLASFKQKVTSILQQLDLPVNVYAATAHDKYRKPRIGMWEEMLQGYELKSPDAVDLAGSFFVGDAGGRISSEGSRKDFSCSDRDLSCNVGIAFHTPEEYFLKEPSQPFTRSFDPVIYAQRNLNTQSQDPRDMTKFQPKGSLEIVMFCGSPGAGKSTFYWEHLKPHGYERVNQDILKTRDKCLEAASRYLEAGKSVAVDNTNATVEVRQYWIELAREHKVPIRCVLFTSSPALCQHNNVVRALNGSLMNPENRPMLPSMAFKGFASRFRAPSLEEGFEEIIQVPFKILRRSVPRYRRTARNMEPILDLIKTSTRSSIFKVRNILLGSTWQVLEDLSKQHFCICSPTQLLYHMFCNKWFLWTGILRLEFRSKRRGLKISDVLYDYDGRIADFKHVAYEPTTPVLTVPPGYTDAYSESGGP